MTSQGQNPASAGPGTHEGPGIDVRLIRRIAGVIAVILILIIAVLWGLFDHLDSKYGARTSEAAPRVTSIDLPPAPRPHADPLRDLKAVRAKEDAHLTRYAWIDRGRGIAQVPIDRAMTLWLRNYSAAKAVPPPSPAATTSPPAATELEIRPKKAQGDVHAP